MNLTIADCLLVESRCTIDGHSLEYSRRVLAEVLARHGFAVGVLGISAIGRGDTSESVGAETRVECRSVDTRGLTIAVPPHSLFFSGGVSVVAPVAEPSSTQGAESRDREDWLELLDARLRCTRPCVVVAYGLGNFARDTLVHARVRGAASVLAIGDDVEAGSAALADADAVLVPSQFAANYIREAYGRECVVLPDLINHDRVRVERHEPKYLTLVNPSVETGVWAFARIADELGRRPDIPILVVEARGTAGYPGWVLAPNQN